MPRYQQYWNRNEDDDPNETRANVQSPAGMSVGSAVPQDYAGGGGDVAPVGRFVNFGRYFSLNQDKAKGMAENVGGKVQSAGLGAKGAVNKATSAFNDAVRQNSLTYQQTSHPPVLPSTPQPDTVDVTPYGPAVQSGEARPPNAVDQVDGLKANDKVDVPASKSGGSIRDKWKSFAPKSASTIEEARGMSGFKYGGPTSLESQAGYGDLEKQVSDAEKKANQLGTDSGLGALLGEEYGALGGYETPMGGGPTGKSRLDTALMGTAGRPMFGEIGRQFGGNQLTGHLATARANAAQTAKNAAASSADAAGKYGKDVADYDAARGALNAANAPKKIPAAPGVGGAPGELGWEGERSGPSFENLFNSGFKTWNDTEQHARQVESDSTKLETWKTIGYNGKSAGSVWLSKEFGVANEVSQKILDSMNEEDMSAWREANKKGPDSLYRWWQAMLAKYWKG